MDILFRWELSTFLINKAEITLLYEIVYMLCYLRPIGILLVSLINVAKSSS